MTQSRDLVDRVVVRRADRMQGEVHLPADKSIAHRAALFSALGDGTSTIRNYPSSADPQSTLSALRQLGVQIETEAGVLMIEGRGLRGLIESAEPVDCGNSGTTMRLLAGILAGHPFESTLVGDASLSGRPMDRIAMPLREMGARMSLTNGHAPVVISGARSLHGIVYRLPVPSAQVKSCVLLAGHLARGTTTVIETATTRDHTERMLGLSTITMDGLRQISVSEGRRIAAREWLLPSDFSAAAFFMVAGSIIPGSDIRMERVGLNPTRNALLDVLQAMGADIQVYNESVDGGEPVADLRVRSADMEGVTVSGDLISNLIDEIPVLAVAGAVAGGRTEIRDAAELRVKETDRIRGMVDNLRRLGANVEELDDGMIIEGDRPLRGTEVESFGDHRIAMAMGVAGLVAAGETVVSAAACADVSFPGFWETLRGVANMPSDPQ